MIFEKRAFAPPPIGTPEDEGDEICVSNWLPAVPVIEPTLITLMKEAKPVIIPATGTKVVNRVDNLKAGSDLPAPIALKS